MLCLIVGRIFQINIKEEVRKTNSEEIIFRMLTYRDVVSPHSSFWKIMTCH